MVGALKKEFVLQLPLGLLTLVLTAPDNNDLRDIARHLFMLLLPEIIQFIDK